MKENSVSYDIALKLKELGFDEECLACYSFDGTSLNYDTCEESLEDALEKSLKLIENVQI